MKVTVAQYKIPDWRSKSSHIELRVSANDTYIADDGLAGRLIEAGSVYRKVTCTVANELIDGYTSPVLTIPEITLYSTLDAIVNKGATLHAGIYDTRNGILITEFNNFSSFCLKAIDNTSWTDIAFDNDVIPFINRPNYDEELKAYVDSLYMNRSVGGYVGGDITSDQATNPPTDKSLVNKGYIDSVTGDADDSGSSHRYKIQSGNFNVPNEWRVRDVTADQDVMWYDPATSELNMTHLVLDEMLTLTQGVGLGNSILSVDNGGAVNIIKNNYTATNDPVVGNNFASGYGYGSKWYNSTTQTLFECVGNGVWWTPFAQ